MDAALQVFLWGSRAYPDEFQLHWNVADAYKLKKEYKKAQSKYRLTLDTLERHKPYLEAKRHKRIKKEIENSLAEVTKALKKKE